MASSYPTSVDNHTELTDGVDIIQANDQNLSYQSIDAIQTFVGPAGATQANSVDMLEYLANTLAPRCEYATDSTITVTVGSVLIKDSGQSIRVMRRITSPITVTASDIDTGALAANTYYYLFAVADATATTFTVKFSLSSTAPTGLTNFELIGWFYNETITVLDIPSKFIGNVKGNGRDVPNTIFIGDNAVDTINDTSYGSDLTGLVVRFYTSGRPLRIDVLISVDLVTTGITEMIVDISGTDKTDSEQIMEATNSVNQNDKWMMPIHYQEQLAAGVYTITIQAKVSTGSVEMDNKRLSVTEL